MIELKNVSYRYSSETDSYGLNNINLEIKKGECILLCGESGCGKTTLTRIINGLIPNYFDGHLSGSVIIDNINTIGKELYEIASIVGSVFQNPKSQFFTSDTTNELAFVSENLGYDKEYILDRIKKVSKEQKLERLLNRNIWSMSGGEKQKIACGSISVANQELLVLDEPSSNLDFEGIKELRNIIKDWKSQGKTIIIAEHRLYYLMDTADRVIYMRNGNISNDFSIDEFLMLGRDERYNMGLRTSDLCDLKASPTLSSSNKDMTVNFENFNFAYNKSKYILKIDNLNIPEGSIVAVIGNNGAGKSTFAKCICGLTKKCGKITCDSKAYGWKERLKKCYMVMQDVNHQLFTESVIDEVLLSMDEENIEEANSVLKLLNLFDIKERHPVSLSGGQKQRTAIATSIVSKKEIMVFDEPTSGLDYKHMLEVSEIIKNYSKETKLTLIVSHDPEFISNCCNYVVHLERGIIKDQYPITDITMKKIIANYLVK